MTPARSESARSEDAGACATCHRAEADEWSASLHRSAFTDRDFQASFKVEPMKFCFDCHAPEAKDRGDARGAAVGVGCTSCHTIGSGHGSENVAARTTDCAGCHQFTFPGRTALMQSTMTEHARSPLADRSCTSCHLPRARDGHRDHRFDVSRNIELLRAAIRVESRRTDAGIEITLVTRDVGHAMPTGDLFRRLRIVVRAEASDGHHLGEEEVVLARRFDRTRGMPVESQDTRVFGERRVHVDGRWLTAASRVDIEVRYERVAQTVDVEDVRGELQRREAVFASELLAELSLDSAPDPTTKAPAPRAPGSRSER